MERDACEATQFPTTCKGGNFFVKIGPAGTVSDLMGIQAVFLMQTYGTKEAYLVDPKDYKKVDCLMTSPWVDTSQIVNIEEFQKLKSEEGITVYKEEIHERDILYILDNWLHDIR